MNEPTTELVTIHGTESVTTTLALAHGIEAQHKNVMDLIRTYSQEMGNFGLVAFERQASH